MKVVEPLYAQMVKLSCHLNLTYYQSVAENRTPQKVKSDSAYIFLNGDHKFFIKRLLISMQTMYPFNIFDE